jgi:hypothetical protein
LKRSAVFLADDADTEQMLAASMRVGCGESSTTVNKGANRPTAVITECPLFG